MWSTSVCRRWLTLSLVFVALAGSLDVGGFDSSSGSGRADPNHADRRFHHRGRRRRRHLSLLPVAIAPQRRKQRRLRRHYDRRQQRRSQVSEF